MKQIFISMLLTMIMSTFGIEASAHDIAVANSDGKTIYYNYINNNTELEVTYQGNYSSNFSSEYIGNVVIPESVTYNGTTYSVTSIGWDAFKGCTYLKSVTIPNSVTSIGWEAFSSCSGLTSVTIPNSVTSIGSGAFSNTAWYNNQPSGLVYAGKVLYKYKGTMLDDTSIVIDEGTLGITGSAFYGCSGLSSVTIPNSVTNIGQNAFEGCSGLTNVTIPNSVTSIGSEAFANCSSLSSVTMGTGLLSIGDNVFSGHTPAKIIWLTNTPPNGYGSAKGTVNYVANDLYTSLYNKTVYKFLSSSFEVDGVKYVPVSPSERTCDAIDCIYDESAEHIKIGKTITYKGVSMSIQHVRPYTCYHNTHIKDVELSYSGPIGNNTFRSCTNLKTATLGEQITVIGNYAFSGCNNLQGIVIPDAATSIGQYAFQNCSKMESAKIGSSVETIGTYAFENCSSLPLIEIPKSVTKIDNYVFSGCTALKDVYIADRTTELSLGCNGISSSYDYEGKPLFSDCPLDSVYIGGNVSYNTSKQYGYSPFYRNTSLRAVHISDQETEISANEFYGCTGLKNVRIGDGVTTIGNWAFSGCSSLSYFAFGSSLQTIGQEAFSDCTAVGEIISKAATPPTCGSQAIDDISKWECKLFVPEGTLATYQQADQWKDFFFAEEGAGSDNPGIHESEKCATPVITFADGKLKFTCATAGVEYHYDITADGSKSGTGSQTDLTTTYTISVYASKEGFDNSETVRKTITTGGTGGQVGDVNGDGEVNAADIAKLVEIILGKNKN